MSTSLKVINRRVYEYKWAIDDFNQRIKWMRACDQLASDVFTIAGPEGATFNWLFWPYDRRDGAYLWLVVQNPYKRLGLNASMTIYIQNSDGKQLHIKGLYFFILLI